MEELGGVCSTRVIGTQSSTLNKDDFLRQVARFIILNKDHLPDDTRLSLVDAFGKRNKSSSTKLNRPRANNARERIEQAREIDIIPSSEILTSITRIEETPADFWTAGLSVDLDWDKNILRHIYHGNRRNENLAVTYRAFYTTATYLFIRSICEAFNVRVITDRVLRYCSALIDPHCEENAELVKQNLKDDYKAGHIWNTYAEHLGGYGAFFLIGVAPTWMFEISLNQSDDLIFAVSHFKSINVPHIAAQYNLHRVGSTILSEITRHIERRPKERTQNERDKASKPRRPKTNKSIASAEIYKCQKRPHSKIYGNLLQNKVPRVQALLSQHHIDTLGSSATQVPEAGQHVQASCCPFTRQATPEAASSTSSSSTATPWSVSSSTSLESRSQECHAATSEHPLQANMATPEPNSIEVRQNTINGGMQSHIALQPNQMSRPPFNVEHFAAGQSLRNKDQDNERTPQSHQSRSPLLESFSLEQRLPISTVEEREAGSHMDSRGFLTGDLLNRNGSDADHLNRNPDKSVHHATVGPTSPPSSSMLHWGNWSQRCQLTMSENPVQADVTAPERFCWNNHGQNTKNISHSAGTGTTPTFFWGNWDQDYEDPSQQAEIGVTPAFFAGNWDQDYDNTPGQPAMTSTFFSGNWDQNYEDASRQADIIPAFFAGNWDQDYDAALAGPSIE